VTSLLARALARIAARILALGRDIPDIAPGRLARDVSLANRVRSGRKQP